MPEAGRGSRSAPGIPGTGLVIAMLASGLIAAAVLRLRSVVPPRDGGGGRQALVDLNHASTAELSVLPGIGPRLGQRIADDRAARGPFRSIDDLERVPGIGPIILDRIRPFVVVGDSGAGAESGGDPGQ